VRAAARAPARRAWRAISAARGGRSPPSPPR
jgi:hypothetical protein